MLERLQEIIRCYAENDELIITGDMVLLTDLGFNSFDLVELVYEVDRELDIEIPDRALSRFKTVQHILDYLAAHV